MRTRFKVQVHAGEGSGATGVARDSRPASQCNAGASRLSVLSARRGARSGSAKIKFSIPVGTGHPDQSGQVASSLLKVYDVFGHAVATLVSEYLQPASYEVTFDCTGLASGVYFYRLTTGAFVATKRIVLMGGRLDSDNASE